MSSQYDVAGYGGNTVGFGLRPAVVVVDFQRAFTEPAWPAGRSAHIHAAVARTVTLLHHARTHRVPVVACNVAWAGAQDMAFWKVSSLYDGSFFRGHPATELDPRVVAAGCDFTFTKSAPSIFFQTPLMLYLVRHHIDTVIVTGCTTSGCVRASIVDSFSHGFRTVVPEQCVGDQEEQPHRDNLRDVGRRYADVVDVEDVMRYFEALDRA